jgi:hypothetical protein
VSTERGAVHEQRALAMHYSDQWVQAGCDLESSLIAQERVALVRSYAELLVGVPQSSQKRDECLTGDGVRFVAGAERTGELLKFALRGGTVTGRWRT